jgi:hypothetical protein
VSLIPEVDVFSLATPPVCSMEFDSFDECIITEDTRNAGTCKDSEILLFDREMFPSRQNSNSDTGNTLRLISYRSSRDHSKLVIVEIILDTMQEVMDVSILLFATQYFSSRAIISGLEMPSIVE